MKMIVMDQRLIGSRAGVIDCMNDDCNGLDWSNGGRVGVIDCIS